MVNHYSEGVVGLLSRLLADSPKLPGAACSTSPLLFDPPDGHEQHADVVRRHEAAARMCTFTCPALDECKTWFNALPPRQRPAGVVAGRRPNLPAAPGRPSKGLSA